MARAANDKSRISDEASTAATKVLFDLTVFSPDIGYGYTALLPTIAAGDDADRPANSLAQLFEDGAPLGPAHARHADIRQTGLGRYSHWRDTLFLSSSDNTDPRVNGRIYHLYLPDSGGSAISQASNVIKTLSARYDAELAYTAAEACLKLLDPTAVLGDDSKRYWHDDAFLSHYRRVAGENRRAMERKYALYQLAKSLSWVPGDVAECGTWTGGSAYFMALAGREIGDERALHIFDSFQGISAPTEFDGTIWRAGDLAVPVTEVESVLGGFKGIHIYPGWIPNEFHRVSHLRFRLVHIDVDLHEPTRDTLEFFYPRLALGGMIVCDDYGSTYCPGARKAMDDYMRDKPERIVDLPTMQGLVIKQP